jgi:hypothetical protein
MHMAWSVSQLLCGEGRLAVPINVAHARLP